MKSDSKFKIDVILKRAEQKQILAEDPIKTFRKQGDKSVVNRNEVTFKLLSLEPDPKLKIAEISKRAEEQQKLADVAIKSFESVVNNSNLNRNEILFESLTKISWYLEEILHSASNLIEKRKKTIPALQYMAEQFEKQKKYHKIVETCGSILAWIGSSLDFAASIGAIPSGGTSLSLPVIAGLFQASAAATSIGTTLAIHIIGKKDFNRISDIINEDNCACQLLYSSFRQIVSELKYLNDEFDIIPTTAFYLIFCYNIKKHSQFKVFIQKKSNNLMFDLVIFEDEKKIESLIKELGMYDYVKFSKKSSLFCRECTAYMRYLVRVQVILRKCFK